jgi:hypothetical protein
MTFEEILDQAMAMLQRRGRLTYRTLQRQFQLDDAALEDLKDEIIYGQRLAVDEDGRVLVWTGGTDMAPAIAPRTSQLRSRKPLVPRLRHHSPYHHLTPNVANSPYCSVTWWTRPCSPANSTRRSCVRWCGPIKRPVPG